MLSVAPASAKELAECLKNAAARSQSISVIGNNSKRLMAGPLPRANISVSTVRLNRVLAYEPNDLTISVEAGLRWSDLQKILEGKRQMVALDPPFWEHATVGGVVASNSNGPLRRNFGTARDLVIGMQFAALDGKIVRVGGMVVKNVAGLDIGKLMIGSFGTLAVITSVNFRLHAVPEETNTFLFSFPDLDGSIQKRDEMRAGVLRPFAVDLLTPVAAARVGLRGYLLAVRAGGSRKVLARYAKNLDGSNQLSGQDDQTFWAQIREFPADFLSRQPGGVILRCSTLIGETGKLLRLISGAAITRAASGITYTYLSSWRPVPALWQAAAEHGWTLAVEFAPDDIRSSQKLWLPASPAADSSFAMMKKIKEMFDPGNLLNRARLYGRI